MNINLTLLIQIDSSPLTGRLVTTLIFSSDYQNFSADHTLAITAIATTSTFYTCFYFTGRF